MTYTKMDLKTSGAVTIAGGEYGKVEVSASLKVAGSLKCDTMSCSGSTKIEGDLDCIGHVSGSGSTKIEGSAAMGSGSFSGALVCEQTLNVANELSSSGSVKVGNDLRMGDGKFSGACKVGGNLSARNLHCSGKLDVVGSICAQELRCSGKLETEGGVEAEHFRSSGALEIEGLLNAEKVEIEVNSFCEVADIGGGTIEVKRDWYGLSFGRGRPRLEARTVEGDSVHLECTRALTVRGKNIHIGRDCEIDCVEYSGELVVDGGYVRQQVRID